MKAKTTSVGQFTALGIYLVTYLLLEAGTMIEFALLMKMTRSCEDKIFNEDAKSEKISRANSKSFST